MTNIVSIDGGKPEHEDRFYMVFTFIDGEVKAWEGDYIGHDVQHSPIMIVLTGPEETQIPVAAVNSEQVKYVSYISKEDVTVLEDGQIMFPETGLAIEGSEDPDDPWNQGYV